MQAVLDDLVEASRGDRYAASSRHYYVDRLALKDSGRVRLIDVSEIRWIAAAGVYVTIHTARESHLHREALGSLEDQLDPRQFLRIHRSHIVNFHFVRELVQDAHGDYVVMLNDGTALNIGRMYRSRLEERLHASPGVRIAAAAVDYCIPSPVTKLWRRSGILRTLTVSNPVLGRIRRSVGKERMVFRPSGTEA